MLVTLGIAAVTLSGCLSFVSSDFSRYSLKPGQVAKVKILTRVLNLNTPRSFGLIVVGIPTDGSVRIGKPRIDENGKIGGPYPMVRDDDVAAYLLNNELCLPFYLVDELYKVRVYRTKQRLPRDLKPRLARTTLRVTQKELVEAALGGNFPLYVGIGNMIEDGDGVFDPDAIDSNDSAGCTGGSATWIRLKPTPTKKPRLDLPLSLRDALDSIVP